MEPTQKSLYPWHSSPTPWRLLHCYSQSWEIKSTTLNAPPIVDYRTWFYSNNELAPLNKEQLLVIGNVGLVSAVPYTTAQGKGQAVTKGVIYFQSFKLLVKVNSVPRHTDPSEELRLRMTLFIYTNSTRSQECPNAHQKPWDTCSGKGLWPPVFPSTHLAADGAVVSVNFPEGLTTSLFLDFPPTLLQALSFL